MRSKATIVKMALDRFENAMKDLAFKGSQPPEWHDAIIQEAKDAREAVRKIIEE